MPWKTQASKLTQEDIENMTRPGSIKELELIINNLPKQRSPGLKTFTGKFCQTFKEEIISILYHLFQKLAAEKTLPNSFYEVSITLKSKQTKTFQNSMHVCMLSRFSCVHLSATPWTVAHQAPLSMGFSRQEYWSGLPCPSLGDLPNPEIESVSLKSPVLAGRLFKTNTTWEAHKKCIVQTSFSHEHRCKNPQQNVRKINPTVYKTELYTTS